MAIATTDIKIYKSTGNLGGAITANESVSAQSGNLFDTFSGAETAAGGTFYHCFYVKNEHGTLSAQALQAYINSETAHAGVNVSLAKGTAAINATEASITNENTAPAGVTFGDTDTTTTGEAVADDTIVIGDLPAGQHQALWVRVQIDAATAAKTGYQANMKFEFDTAE